MLTGVILAGGQSRRMGNINKALLPFSDETLVQRQIQIMQVLCAEIILVANDPRAFLPHLGNTCRIISDYIPGKGPLSGMHAAFTLSTYTDIWVVGCDMPFISSRAAEFMKKQRENMECDAVVPCIQGAIHPLHGIYRKSCVDHISSLLNHGEFRVSELLNAICCETVMEDAFVELGLDLRFVLNVNTPEEYGEAVQLLKR
jgi:molybdopterin-guanine dinucleotide biosynthesis protein A